MKRLFTFNIIFLVLINLLVKPIYVLLIDVEVQNTIGTESYGSYFAIFNFCYLFQIIADLGIQNFNSQNVSKNREHSLVYFPHILGVKLILSLAFVVLAAIFFRLIGFGYTYKLFGLIAFNQILVSFILYVRGNLAALGHFTINSALSILDKLLLIIILVYLLWFSNKPFTIYDFVLVQTWSLGITLLLALSVHNTKQKFQLPKLDLDFSKKLLTKSLPYALVIVLMTAYTRMDAVMLERLLQDQGYEAGVYAAAYRLLDAANMLAFLFAGLLLPMFAHILDNHDELHALCSIALRTILCGAIPLTVYICFFSGEITNYLYDEATQNYADTLSMLFPTFLAMSIGYIYGTLLTAAAEIRKLNWYFLFGILLNFGLNLFLIPKYKAQGAAVATLITQFFVAVMQFYLATKILKLNTRIPNVIRGLVFILTSICLFYILKTQLNYGFFISLIIGMSILLLVAIPLKMLELKDFIKMSQS